MNLTVIIPCHDYGSFLSECIQSIRAAGVALDRIVVIADACSDDTAEIAASEGVQCLSVKFRNLNMVRAYGLNLVETKYVAFIDADNKVLPEYFSDAIAHMEKYRNIAFVFPVLQCFGDSDSIAHGTEQSPMLAQARHIEDQNYCDGNSVWRTEALRSSLAIDRSLPARVFTHDWMMARRVLRAGWYATRSKINLMYRVHGKQMTHAPELNYCRDACLLNERVTIIIAFSGRAECWKRLRFWIKAQTHTNVRLLIMNGTHTDLSPRDLDLHDFPKSLTIEKYDAGEPGLADEDRRTGEDIRKRVEAAVAGIYNRAVQMAAPDEYLLFLEDDVIPPITVIDDLLRLMKPKTFAISGLYRHRYHEKACAFSLPISSENLLPLDGPDFEQVHGTGFGCLLARRSVLLSNMLSGDDETNPHYDCDLAARLLRSGWKWYLSRAAKCEHLIGVH